MTGSQAVWLVLSRHAPAVCVCCVFCGCSFQSCWSNGRSTSAELGMPTPPCVCCVGWLLVGEAAVGCTSLVGSKSVLQRWLPTVCSRKVDRCVAVLLAAELWEEESE